MKLNRLRIDTLSYLWLVIGSVADEVSTRIGLTYPFIYESNRFASGLMDKGLWLAFDVSIVVLSIIGVSFYYDRLDESYRDVILVYPIVLGTLRFIASIWNISLIL